MAEVHHLTDDNSTSFLKDKEVVVVKYYAAWCGPCQITSPIFHDLAAGSFATNHPEISWAEVDIDEALDTATDQGVMSIPTFIVYKKGEEVERYIGSVTAVGMQAIIERNL
ncbi:thioredoxin family protein [Microgenomates group bacterium]|nr:thioredoxin family protein [Microgenomates group bacterium]